MQRKNDITNQYISDTIIAKSNTEAKQRLMSAQFNYDAFYDQTGGDKILSTQANGNVTANSNAQIPRPIWSHKSFRSISIFPEYNDVHCSTNPNLPFNIVNGKFASVERYLEIHFRLNREDFVRPFRDGIKEYRKAINCRKNVNELRNVRIYTDVHILGSQYQDYKYEVQFDTTNLTQICWNVSKRLINGSLVCLTANNFQTFCFATVCGERDVEMLSNGQIRVEIIPDSIDKEFIELLCDSSKSLIMAESVVYFEYYRHTLITLQHFSAKTFPLKEYIIDVSNNVKTVPYLTTNSSVYNLSYNASPVINELLSQNEQTNQLNSADSRKTFNSVNNNNKSPLEGINILDAYQWPEHDLLALDRSQYHAFKVALTKQIAIIQGPPGTGKTYVGLRIAQTLLQNKKIWNKIRFGNKRTPIVIVAKTNHALDQFLEGLVPYCRNDNRLVRIGCQSKSEILKKYDLDRNNYSNSDSIYAKLIDAQTELLSYQSIIDKLKKQLMSDSELELLDDSKYRDIVAQLSKYNDNICLALIKWLNPNLTIELEPEYLSTITEKVNSVDVNDDIDEMIDCRIIETNDYKLLSKGKSGEYIVDNLTNLFGNLRISDKEKIDVQKIIEKELKSSDVMSEKEANFVHDIMRLPPKDRWRLYRLWMSVCVEKLQHMLNETDRKYRKEMLEFNKVKKDLISNCDIIGFTTTGAAKYRQLIDEIDPFIVIIEEAAEVLESHVITALTESTCHLILIGDHQQLRPNPVVYELAVKKNLDVSMFERLIRNRLPYCQLKVQHRMCPLISSLLVPHFYDELIDHESVKHYETVRGVSKHVYFINHSQPESSIDDSTSKMNRFEAEFIARLCRYLTQQEYEQSQITILTMYSAQCFHLRNILKQCKPSLSKVRVAVVDNFQGEENDIILLSFVRSNNSGDIGFLKIANRVNVGLSRAKRGMYCIGNFDCLAQKSETNRKFQWKKLKEYLHEKDIIGNSLEIYCQNHTERIISVSKASDFDNAFDGGCDKHCPLNLKCGHECPLLCHPYDKEHENVVCIVPCPHFVCDLKHKCEKLCHFGKVCGKCYKPVSKVIPSCGHNVSMACCIEPSKFHCPEPCKKLRSCGHECCYSCGYICDEFPCKVQVIRRLACGHNEVLRCSADVSVAYCSNACQKMLACGHACTYNCGDVCDVKSCAVLVSVKLKCGHLLERKCSDREKKAFCNQLCNRFLECGHHCRKYCRHHSNTDGICKMKYCNNFFIKKFDCGHEAKVRCNPKSICNICNYKPNTYGRNSSKNRVPFKQH